MLNLAGSATGYDLDAILVYYRGTLQKQALGEAESGV